MRVLVVEDHPGLAKNVARALRDSAAYAVDISPDGEDGLFLAQSNPYDLILLDLMLPKIAGLDILRSLRKQAIRSPVLILTSRDVVARRHPQPCRITIHRSKDHGRSATSFSLVDHPA